MLDGVGGGGCHAQVRGRWALKFDRGQYDNKPRHAPPFACDCERREWGVCEAGVGCWRVCKRREWGAAGVCARGGSGVQASAA